MAADKRHGQWAGRALPPKDADENTAPQAFGIELIKAGNLLDTVNTALTKTVNGEFFEGTKSSNANRHRQLPEIFQSRDQIEGVLESVSKKERLLAEQERIKNEGGGKPAVSSATIQAMVQSAVQQQLAMELRDLQIKNERLQERLVKIESKQPVTIDGAKKVKKLPPANQDDVKILQRKVIALETECQQYGFDAAAQNTEIYNLQVELATLRMSLNAQKEMVDGQGRNIRDVEMQVSEISLTLDTISNRDTGNNDTGEDEGGSEDGSDDDHSLVTKDSDTTRVGNRLVDNALGGTVLEDVESADSAKFNKGSMIFEVRAVMQELLAALEKADKIGHYSVERHDSGHGKSAVEEKVVKRVGDKQVEVDRLREKVEMLKNQLPIKIDDSWVATRSSSIGCSTTTSSRAEITNIRAREVIASQNVETIHGQIIGLKHTVASLAPPAPVSTPLSVLENDLKGLQKTPSCETQDGLRSSRAEKLEEDLCKCKAQCTSNKWRIEHVDDRIGIWRDVLTDVNSKQNDRLERLEPDVKSLQSAHSCAPGDLDRSKAQARDLKAVEMRIARVKEDLNDHKGWVRHEREIALGYLALICDELTTMPSFNWDSATKKKADKLWGRELPGNFG
ncbi:hypothetical protein DOTSEDRAFT_36617 [Dothistroma septosporum NZE10]|uniref:Uncharacterized protein n=1 Tax=Dothistroma septosporum (strain NZE10 / CBS 128990) TaxID=675120 RepID=N1PIN3_DOTSN|nr:hypothetical protein DOTSEDRAFT_36617 [Dothistroma septosporum NZE10]